MHSWHSYVFSVISIISTSPCMQLCSQSSHAPAVLSKTTGVSITLGPWTLLVSENFSWSLAKTFACDGGVAFMVSKQQEGLRQMEFP